MKTSELIARMQELDPEGEMDVGMPASGGEVELVLEVERDEVWVALDHEQGGEPYVAMATRGRNRNHSAALAKVCTVRKKDAVFIS